jgi:hypothetical protein
LRLEEKKKEIKPLTSGEVIRKFSLRQDAQPTI